MIDGIYKIEVSTPLGTKPGTVSICTSGDVAEADIDAPIVGKQHVQGQVSGDSFKAQGVFKLGLLGKVSYSLQGVVDGDKISIAIDSSKGTFNLSGVRA